MIDLKNKLEEQKDSKEKNIFNFKTIAINMYLHWKWIILSIVVCIAVAFVYLRYATKIYQANAKILIKDESNRGNSIKNTANLGLISNSYGIENETEILKSRSLAQDIVRDLKLNYIYKTDARLKDRYYYKNHPITVEMDSIYCENLNQPVTLQITKEGDKYSVEGTYFVANGNLGYSGPYNINTSFKQLPARIRTKVGYLSFFPNGHTLDNGQTMNVIIQSPQKAALKYTGSLSVESQKTNTILYLGIKDEVPQRALDYLRQLVICYNRQANEDKNTISMRTEAFINNRLEKINAELGSTEGALESYKRSQGILELTTNVGNSMSSSSEFEKKLANANTQVELVNSISNYMTNPENKYQTLPANVGLEDASLSSLINKYNEIVLERNRLLRSASENSPSVTPLTSQLDDLNGSIQRAMAQNKRNLEIQRNAIASQYNKYSGEVYQSPQQERMLNQIGRQQEVKSGLYLMLLQKREENSISLAATADKGKLIDEPYSVSLVSPQTTLIYIIALIIGLLIPIAIIIIKQLLRIKIEGHDDVETLTSIPIIADVAVANESVKNKSEIVVSENKNSQMEEVFRLMRTNLQFILKNEEKVILFTSTISGEGKTFNATNLAMSFAVLGKKVLLMGLDIRKPRLSDLFHKSMSQKGITTLLARESSELEDIKNNIENSEVHNNFDIMFAGPIPPNPTELLARQTLGDIIRKLRDMYDVIILDTAPVGLVTDTLEIGSHADATVFVCRADYTPKTAIANLNKLVEENKLPNVSIALNGIDMSKKKYGYAYGYGKYGKYGYGQGYSLYGSNSSYGSADDNSVKQ